MNNLKLVLLSAMLLTVNCLAAQDINQAFNFSNLSVQGTARSMGFGNGLGSIGGDFGSLSVNPAGLGVYRSSEIAITPTINMNNSSTDFLGVNTTDNNLSSNINHFGLVLTNAPKGERYEHRNWKTVSFAIGINKVADFNRNYSYTGKNTTSSASMELQADANKNPQDTGISGTLGYLGYQGYLLNIDSNNKFYSIVPYKGGINQTNSVQQSGGINEFVLSLGGNYKEKLMLGFTVGIPTVVYNLNSQYTETVASGNTSNTYNFTSFNYNQNISVTGGGINAKIGAILKLNDLIRIGASFHTPTYYSLEETSTPEMYSQVNGNKYALTVPNGALNQNIFDYTLTTPWKGVLSGAVILRKLGFITADVEYVDYSTMRYQYPGGYDNNNGTTFQQEASSMNSNISNSYQATVNYRLGAEIKLAQYLMVRGGVGYYGNPYKATSGSNYNAQRLDISCGLGFHFHHFFTDFGFLQSNYMRQEQPYSSVDYTNIPIGKIITIPTAKINYVLNTVALTIGFKF